MEISYSFLTTNTCFGELYLSVPNNVKQNHLLMNANFPAGLSISHSSFPSTSQFNLGSLDVRREDSFGFLGAEAQDTAIAKYGIAGRVW
jgi:hypothetical protein